MTASESKRYYYIDWLRVLAILMVFLFHNARFFDAEDWHVKNAETGQGFTIFTTFTSQWLMPLFFILSGSNFSIHLPVPSLVYCTRGSG